MDVKRVATVTLAVMQLVPSRKGLGSPHSHSRLTFARKYQDRLLQSPSLTQKRRYTAYNAELSGRITRGGDTVGCKADKWFLKGITDTRITGEWTIGEDILPQTSQNPGNLPIGNPVSISSTHEGQG